MTFSLYDSALGRQVPFVPLVPGEVTIYCCGLTVYSAPHLGHIRKEVVFDTLRRWLTWTGHNVSLVVNVTDIDDKILRTAAENGRSWFAHAYLNERLMHRAMAAVGCQPPTYEPHATGTIPEQIELVQAIMAAGHAYAAPDGSGDVYFDVLSFPAYGELSHQRVDDMESAGDADPRGKRDPRDFALWKGHNGTDPVTASWPSPWGRGRPGWHLECSAMAGKFLGDAFDIHGGGIDLKFPHHENERAQSMAAGLPFAHHWMHNAFVTDPSGEKMAKSLGNYMGVLEVVQRHHPRAVRHYLAAPHYRSMVDFSDQAVDEAATSLARLDSFTERATARVGAPPPGALVAPGAPGDTASRVVEGTPLARFAAAMDDDLGTPAALAALHEAARDGNRALDANDDAAVAAALAQTQTMLSILGLAKDDPVWAGTAPADDLAPIMDGLVRALLEQRQAARARRDFAAADQIRDQLGALGLTVEDTAQGPRWTRLTGRTGDKLARD